ncbi:hypothetical protein N3K66_005879 [Trichothecium roseum]|uniref:Uncharacterized protein n=1 Tax=Trichothecium roseum TaxID=47278 RepID=A0ACC0V0G7_9HYPO|nr:hypothetical protein N3K66_005879 [Trichothecium roseum]
MESGCDSDFDVDATPAPAVDGIQTFVGLSQDQYHNQQQQQQQQQQNVNGGAQQEAAQIDQRDRQMLRKLMDKYSAPILAQMMQEEGMAYLPPDDKGSIITSSSISSTKSGPSIFDGAGEIRTLSHPPGSTRSSLLSNVSSKLLKGKSHGNASSTSLPSASQLQHRVSSSSSPSLNDVESITESMEEQQGSTTTSAAKQKGTFVCGFCKEEDIQKSCTRKNDLKRHIEDFHHMNAQWFCSQRGCNMVYDWQTAYKTHLKNSHGGSRISLDESKVNLCPQTVFACGFDGCLSVFEATSDADSAVTFKEYVGHVVKHFDEGSDTGRWSYSTRIRNLMRQSGILGAWANSPWPEEQREKMRWEPQLSGVLRKKLETRHLGNAQMLVQYAIALASDPSTVPDLRQQGFVVPVREECTTQIPGHQNHLGSMANATPAVSESDQYQFRIPRGSNSGPAAGYWNFQRRMQAPTARPAARPGRSARPPIRTIHGHAHPHPPQGHVSGQSFQQPMAPNMFDPGMFAPHQQQQQQQPQQHHQQQFIMPADDGTGGIIGDDLHSLRTMASSSGSGDVDMRDSYHQPQTFAGTYMAGALPAQHSVDNLANPGQQGQSYPHPGYASSAHTF